MIVECIVFKSVVDRTLFLVVVCGDTALRHPCSRFCSRCRRVKSTALSSICKLPPGSVVPSRIVAEPSHILFDGFDVNRHFASVPGAQQCRLQSCSSGSSQQLQLVLFDVVELSRPATPSTNRISTMSNSIELHRQSHCMSSSNVELYRSSRITVTMVPPSTMSNSDTAN